MFEKNENKQKEAGAGPLLKNTRSARPFEYATIKKLVKTQKEHLKWQFTLLFSEDHLPPNAHWILKTKGWLLEGFMVVVEKVTVKAKKYNIQYCCKPKNFLDLSVFWFIKLTKFPHNVIPMKKSGRLIRLRI